MRTKHAYLILVHSEPNHFKRLLGVLDDPRNDIFVHIDAKSDLSNFTCVSTKFSSLTFIKERIDVKWGHISQIYAEYALFKSLNNPYEYSHIHLISGVDFPIKSQDYIHNFFEKYPDTEFISFENEVELGNEIKKKMRLYNFFLPYVRHRNKAMARLSNFSRRCLLVLQMCLGINRKYTHNDLRKGSNWGSFTPKFISLLLNHENEIKREYKLTHCCDEIYKQTLAMACGFKGNISQKGNLRLIDFKRGNGQSPYTFKLLDYDLIQSSTDIFARKFSEKESSVLTEKISKNLLSR